LTLLHRHGRVATRAALCPGGWWTATGWWTAAGWWTATRHRIPCTAPAPSSAADTGGRRKPSQSACRVDSYNPGPRFPTHQPGFPLPEAGSACLASSGAANPRLRKHRHRLPASRPARDYGPSCAVAPRHPPLHRLLRLTPTVSSQPGTGRQRWKRHLDPLQSLQRFIPSLQQKRPAAPHRQKACRGTSSFPPMRHAAQQSQDHGSHVQQSRVHRSHVQQSRVHRSHVQRSQALRVLPPAYRRTPLQARQTPRLSPVPAAMPSPRRRSSRAADGLHDSSVD